MSNDLFNLHRFAAAQEGVYAQALAELQLGRKRTHWMWFIFPQLKGLGSSPMAETYGLSGPPEAAAYIAHPLLGLRLLQCTEALLLHRGEPVQAILGATDALKLRSCLTLFARVAPPPRVFDQALRCLYNGQADPLTLRLLQRP